MESTSLPAGGAGEVPGPAGRAGEVPARKPKPSDEGQKSFGSGLKGFFDEMGALTIFCFDAMRAMPGTLRYFSEVLRRKSVITRRTSLLVFVMAGFIGVSIANFGFFFLRSIGASDFVGILPGLVTPRQTAPQMFGYVFSGSVCCAFAAELGSARIQ